MRNRLSLLLPAVAGLALTAVSLLARAGEEVPADPVLASIGAGYFREHCATCHGVGGVGNGPVATALTPRPADLTRIAARREGKFPGGEIAMFIDGRFEVTAHGSRVMPVWGREFLPSGMEPGAAEEIARGRILTLVEYLRSIQQP
jgi:mono/diheme cytochrome c family protein